MLQSGRELGFRRLKFFHFRVLLMPLNNAVQKRSGAAAVELAVSLPVLVLLLFGTIESCTMIFLQQSLEIAAYEGARVAILPKVSETDVRATINQILATRRVRDANVSLTVLRHSDTGGGWENQAFPNYQEAPYGSYIRVDVAAPCRSNAVFNLQFFGERQLTGSVAFMKEF